MLATITSLDTRAYLKVNHIQTRAPISSLFKFISHSGDGYLYAAIAAMLFYSDALLHSGFIKAVSLAFTIEIPSFLLLKALFKRSRPFVQIPDCAVSLTPSDKFSMPSGHAAAAFLMATMIACYYPEFMLLAFLWAGLIGLSRLLLGVHYPSDVLAGMVLGSVIAGCAKLLVA